MPVTLEDADIDEAPLEDDEKDGDGVFGPVREDVILTVGLLDDDVDAEALGEKARVLTDVIVTDALPLRVGKAEPDRDTDEHELGDVEIFGERE